MSIFHSLLFIAVGLACWTQCYFAPSLLTGALWFLMGFGVILVGATSFFERLFERIAKE